MWLRGNDRRTKQAEQPNEMQKKYIPPYVAQTDTIRNKDFCFVHFFSCPLEKEGADCFNN